MPRSSRCGNNMRPLLFGGHQQKRSETADNTR